MIEMIIWIMQFLLGLLIANAGEWFVHRYLLHGLGQKSNSFWAYHFQHHKIVRQSNMMDPGYQKRPVLWNSQAKELLIITCILLINLPFFWWINGYAWAIYFSVLLYYILHRQSHCSAHWAAIYLPWHYHHHFVDSHSNWCISYPLFDYLMKTLRK